MSPLFALWLGQQPGKPKPPGNPPEWPDEPEPDEPPTVPPPAEEPPPPIPPPPADVPPPPIGDPESCARLGALQASRGTGRGLRSASIAT